MTPKHLTDIEYRKRYGAPRCINLCGKLQWLDYEWYCPKCQESWPAEGDSYEID